MSYDVVLRARATRVAARKSRLQAAQARADSRAQRRLSRMVESAIEDSRARREEALQQLGTWPYWAPPSRELWDVLVLVSAA